MDAGPGRGPAGPTDDAAAVTADQLRAVVERLVPVGQQQHGDRDVLVVMDTGHDLMRLAWGLCDLPVELVGQLRSDRDLRLPKPPRVYDPKSGRPSRHGKEFSPARPASWPEHFTPGFFAGTFPHPVNKSGQAVGATMPPHSTVAVPGLVDLWEQRLSTGFGGRC